MPRPRILTNLCILLLALATLRAAHGHNLDQRMTYMIVSPETLELISATELTNALSTAQADADGDGLINLGEYAFGGDPRRADPPRVFRAVTQESSGGQAYFTVHWTRRRGADDLTYHVELSPDLGAWTGQPAQVLEVAVTPNPDGITETVTARILPSPAAVRIFVRLRVTRP